MALAAASVVDRVRASGVRYVHAHFAGYQTELAMALGELLVGPGDDVEVLVVAGGARDEGVEVVVVEDERDEGVEGVASALKVLSLMKWPSVAWVGMGLPAFLPRWTSQ